MGFFTTEKEETKSKISNNKMGLLLVFFPDNNTTKHNPNPNTIPLSSSSSSSSSFSSPIRRTRSSNLILSRAQSTISICAILVLLTFFLFTLSTFEPPVTSAVPGHRRFLLRRDVGGMRGETHALPPRVALQGMGTLFLRGTRGMHDLVVAHVGDDVVNDELRMFLRLMHRSGVTARSDVVLIFGSGSRFDGLIRDENESFLKLVDAYRVSNSTNQPSEFLGFDPTRFLKNHGGKNGGESIWGKKSGGGSRVSNDSAANETESTRLSYGSVVGFDAGELDPENSLSGFLDRVPISLRRWACYPMLLGRVRHSYKHVTLVDARNALFLGDPTTRIRERSPESVLVFLKQQQKRRNSDKNRSNSVVNSAVLAGGAKGVRRLSNAMLMEIVRAATQHKKKNSVSETAVLSQLVGNAHITKNFQVVTSTESIPESSSLTGLKSRNSGQLPFSENYDFILRGNGNYRDINAVIKKQICSFDLDSSVYSDC